MPLFRSTPSWGGAHPVSGKTNNLCLYTDIKIHQDTVRVYNLHFQPNGLKKEDYEFLNNPQGQQDKYVSLRKIVNRLKNGSVKRSRQVDMVAAHMTAAPYPVIVCGDFNHPPSSYTYSRISQGLKDVFLESGLGWGNTYNGIIPLLRTDYKLHSTMLRSSGFRTLREDLSDHFPITCTFSIAHSKTALAN